MFKLLVTTWITYHWGQGGGCGCHAFVIEFNTLQEAEEAKAAINLVPANINSSVKQEALALYRTPQ